MTVLLEPGVKIESYTLEHRLGHGAFGEVWKARDGSETVAIKFVNKQLIEGDSIAKHRERLENEIHVLNSLQHPHIPALYGYDLDFERPYLVMQYIDAPSYETLIATNEMLRIKLGQRLRALQIVAATLSTIHEKGFIHRDIKPASISGIETPYLLDFSIALGSQNVMNTRQDVGTGVYMPPPDEPLGELTDNYSFALVAYEVLFGQHPIFTPSNVGKTVMDTRRLAGEFLRKRKWRRPGSIPADELPGDLRGADLSRLDDIFEKALGPHKIRYTDPVRLVDDLEHAILIPANQPYLDAPFPILPVQLIPSEKHYTDHEVDRVNRDTDNDPQIRAVWLRPALNFFRSLFRHLLRQQDPIDKE